MKISYKAILAAASCALILTGCKGHDEPDPVAKAIVPTYSMVPTKAADGLQDTQIYDGSKVGFFVTDVNGTLLHDNLPYSAASGTLSPVGESMLWPMTGDVNVYAYAPHASATGLSKNNSFTLAADQTTPDGYIASDLMIGAPASNPVKNTAYEQNGNTTVDISFKHKLAKIHFKIKAEGSALPISNGVLTIENTVPTCEYGITAAIATATSGASPRSIKVATNVNLIATTDEFEASAVIVPQTIAANTEVFRLTVGSQSYTFVLAEARAFEGGYEYIYPITVQDNRTQQNLTNNATVVDWTTTVVTGDNYMTPSGTTPSDPNNPNDPNDPGNTPTLSDASVGDWYLADGTYASGSNAAPSNAIGIVFDTTHVPTGYAAYVSAFCDPAVGNWNSGAYKTAEFCEADDAFEAIADAMFDMDGLRKTSDIANSSAYDTFDAIHSALTNAEFSTGKYKAPSTSSGWFVPALGELKLLVEYMAGTTGTWTETSSAFTYSKPYSLTQAYKDAISKLTNPFPTDDVKYWSITEKNGSTHGVFYMNPGSATSNPKLASSGKSSTTARVHLILLAK